MLLLNHPKLELNHAIIELIRGNNRGGEGNLLTVAVSNLLDTFELESRACLLVLTNKSPSTT